MGENDKDVRILIQIELNRLKEVTDWPKSDNSWIYGMKDKAN